MDLFKGLSGKFLVPYFLTVIFGIWTYFSISNIRDYQRIKDTLQTFKIKLLEMRKHEKDFMAREGRNIDYLTNGQSTYKVAFNRISGELDSLVMILDEEEMINESRRDSIADNIKEYTQTFNELTDLIKERGFKDWGLIGKLRNKIHAVEEDNTNYDRYYMLMLRRHEKDFFLRSDMAYLNKFRGGVADFVSHLNQVVDDPVKRDELIQKIKDYQGIFKRVVKLSEAIGLSEDEGAHGELRSAVHQLTPNIEKLVKETTAEADRKVQTNIIILAMLFVAIIGIGIFILRIHIRKITRNINLIKESTQQLAVGLFPKERKVNTKDELGQAHSAINRLIDGLKSKTKFAEKVGKGKLDAELSIQSEEDVLGLSLLEMRKNLKAALDDTNLVIRKAGEEGNLEARLDISARKGAWKELADSINHLLFSVSTPLITLNRIFNEMSKGDLSLRYRSEAKGDIGALTDNLNGALSNLESLLLKVVDTADVVEVNTQEMKVASKEMEVNTGEIATAIGQISSGAQAQVQRVDETSSIAERVLNSSNEMSNRSSLINEAAKKGVENSRRGADMVNNVEQAMAAISTYSNKAGESMEVLSGRSAEITRVLQVINEISSQTNLLALNAAIEAAQAGEAGRGFAVVAEEIRKLAEETRASSQEIQKLVESVTNDTREAVAIMNSMAEVVSSGDRIAKETSSVFEEIAGSTSQTLDLSEQILTAAGSQKDDMQEIVRNTEGIVVIAEQTAAGTEESAASASELSAGMETYNQKVNALFEVTGELKEELGTFQLGSKLQTSDEAVED